MSGICLSTGTCAGFWATFDITGQSAVFMAMVASFVASVGIASIGALLVLVRQVRLTIRRTTAAAALEASAAWTWLVRGITLGVLAVIAWVLLGFVDDTVIAPVFVIAMVLLALGSVVLLAIALVRHIAGR